MNDAEFICKIDETKQKLKTAEEELDEITSRMASNSDSLAREVINMRESIGLGGYHFLIRKELANTIQLLAYGCEHGTGRGKRKTKMDVQATIDVWVPLIKKLAVAHDIDEKDAASSALDDALMPVISAPVAQLREFYRGLTAALKADQSVPWAVWKLFEMWGEKVLDKIDKEELVGLKKELATQIAVRSMEEIPREDWIQSMVGALMWRDPEKLEQVNASLEAGAKPRVKGKESCLFLEVDSHEVML